MRSLTKILILAVASIIMTQPSCTNTPGTGTVNGTNTTPKPNTGTAPDVLANLETNRKRWQDSGVKNYKMTVEIQKPGHATPMGKFVITVRNGVLESTQFAEDLKPVPVEVRFGSYKTVDQIFDYAAAMLRQDAKWSRKTLYFDEKLGYPKRVDLNIEGSLDEEIFIEVLEFEELK